MQAAERAKVRDSLRLDAAAVGVEASFLQAPVEPKARLRAKKGEKKTCCVSESWMIVPQAPATNGVRGEKHHVRRDAIQVTVGTRSPDS